MLVGKKKCGSVPFIEVYESYFTKTKKSDSQPDSREFTTPKAEIVYVSCFFIS